MVSRCLSGSQYLSVPVLRSVEEDAVRLALLSKRQIQVDTPPIVSRDRLNETRNELCKSMSLDEEYGFELWGVPLIGCTVDATLQYTPMSSFRDLISERDSTLHDRQLKCG